MMILLLLRIVQEILVRRCNAVTIIVYCNQKCTIYSITCIAQDLQYGDIVMDTTDRFKKLSEHKK